MYTSSPLKLKKKIWRYGKMFDFTKMRKKENRKTIPFGDGQEITITEFPLPLLLKCKKLQGKIAGAVAKFSVKTPLSQETYKTENMPLSMSEVPSGSKVNVATTNTAITEEPNPLLIDKKLDIRRGAVSDLLDVLLDDALLLDVLRGVVIEFSDATDEQLMSPETGLTIPATIEILLAVMEVNGKDFDKLGNFFSHLKAMVGPSH